MLATFQNSGFVLSIGVFFSLMIAGLASTLPATLTHGLTAQGVPSGDRAPDRQPAAGGQPVRRVPRRTTRSASCSGPTGVLAHLPRGNVATLTGKQFFPELISQPFHHGLVIVFTVAMALLALAAGISALRGGRFVHEEQQRCRYPRQRWRGSPSAAGPNGAGTDLAGPGRADTDAARANGADHPAGDGTPPVRAGRTAPRPSGNS